jgi:hypothetical protein
MNWERLTISRASSIEFNNLYQSWEIRTNDTALITGFKSRAGALAHEVQFLQDRMKE